MKKNCSFKLEKIVGLDTNVFRCSTCDEKVYTKSIWAPVRQCPALQSGIEVPESLQAYLDAGMTDLKVPIPVAIEKDPNGDASKVVRAAATLKELPE